MRDHTKLRAFELADQLAIAVYQATSRFPREEMFGLSAQLRRGAVSVASNIVEGSARSSEAESLHFFDMAYGSAREVEYQIGLALGQLARRRHPRRYGATPEKTRAIGHPAGYWGMTERNGVPATGALCFRLARSTSIPSPFRACSPAGSSCEGPRRLASHPPRAATASLGPVLPQPPGFLTRQALLAQACSDRSKKQIPMSQASGPV